MFGALLFLDASVLYLVKNRSARLINSKLEARQEDSSSSDEGNPGEIGQFAHHALWVASITLSITIACMTLISLLNRNLDAPKTLVINSRLIRIAPRLPATILIICLPLIPSMNGGTWCGAVVSVLYGVFMWEWIAGLERDWKIFESKDE
jgi:hypothetical protein